MCNIYFTFVSCTCNKRWLVGEVHKVRCSAPHLQVYYNANIAFCKSRKKETHDDEDTLRSTDLTSS